MISSNKSPQSGNALIQRIQRYAQASTIFRPSDTVGDIADNAVQRSAIAPTKAAFLTEPSTLPVGRTVDAQGMGSMPVMVESFPEPFSTMTEPTIPSAAAAIEHVEQIQRSPQPQAFNNPPAVPTPQQQVVPPTVTPTSSTANVIQAAPEPETAVPDSDWNRLQRIIKGHKSKEPDNQPTAAEPPPVQRSEAPAETAPPPAPTPVAPADTVQRAIDTAESSQSPAPSKKAPLESIWPVQQVQPETAVTSDEPVVMRQPDTPISAEPVQSADEVETIRRKLGDVSVTQRSDSSVELHLPRRPRPAAIQAKPAKEDPNKAFWDRMRKVEGKAPETVQRTVETEIGPLPADMWELLGETPPDSPTETVTASGESTPDIQPKREEADSVPPPSATDETEIPSFLADAAPTAPNTPDTVQRAIAAAESTVSNETLPPSIQRKETAVSESTSTTALPIKSESVGQPMASSTIISSESQVQPAIQRSIEMEGSDTQLSPVSEEPVEHINLPTTAESSTPVEPQFAPTGESSTSVQRAIAAAETPPAPIRESAATTTPPVSTETSPTAADQPVQPKRADSATTPSAKPAMKAVMPEPIATDTVQREFSVSDSDIAPKATVDLNAETAPLPPLPEMNTPETAVSPPHSSSDTSSSTSDAVQRAVAAAESPTAPPSVPSETAVPTPQASPATSETATPETIQRAVAAAEASTSAPSVSSETAVPTPQSSLATSETATPETIQRSVAAEEAPTATPSVSSQTAVPTPQTSPTTSETATPETIQRAVAAAEAPASSPTEPSQTAVSTPDASPTPTEASTPETIQRAVAAAEAPASSPAEPSQTAVSTPDASPIPTQTSTSETIQRAIAAAEAAVDTPFSIHHSQETISHPQPHNAPASPQTAVQRAIAAAEMAPSMKATTSVIQRAQTTAVTTPTASVQDSGWQGQAETATSAPKNASVAPPAPAVTQSATPTLMRAIATAESAPEPTKETFQWPDISPIADSPPSAAQNQSNIQRDEMSEESFNSQENSSDSASAMENEESEGESENHVDVDKLANEVYSQLKKRLAIEWERGRGKR